MEASCIEGLGKARSPSSSDVICLEPTFSFPRNGACIDREVLSGSSTDKENIFHDRDDSQSGVQQLWWGVIQDQLGSLTKEVESIRISNSESVAHQFDALKLRSRAQDEKMMESMNLLSQLSHELKSVRSASQAHEEKMTESMSRVAPEIKTIRSASHAQEEQIMESMRLITQLGQELKSVKLTVQAEKEECIAACSRLSDLLKTEPAKRAEQLEEVQRGLAQLRGNFEEVRTRQDILDRHGDRSAKKHEELQHGLAQLRENLAEEMRTRQDILDRHGRERAKQHEEVQHDLAQLREHLAGEVRTRQHVLDRQGEKVGQILNAFRNDVQVELDQSRVAVADIAQHVASLREAVQKVSDECSFNVNESSERGIETIARLMADLEALKEDQAVNKSTVQAIGNDVQLVKETLQQKVLTCLEAQGQLLTKECQSQKKQYDDIVENFHSECAKRDKHGECQASIVDELRMRLKCLEEDACKTTPDIDEELDRKLQTLENGFVSKPTFVEEMHRIWEVVNTEPPLKEMHSQLQTLLQKDAVIKADFAEETHRLRSVEVSQQRHTRSRDALQDILLRTQPSMGRHSNNRNSKADVRTMSPTRTSFVAVQEGPPRNTETDTRRIPSASPLRALTPNTSSLYSPRRSVAHTELGLPPRLSSQPGVGTPAVLTPRTVPPSTPPSHLLQSIAPALSVQMQMASTPRRQPN